MVPLELLLLWNAGAFLQSKVTKGLLDKLATKYCAEHIFSTLALSKDVLLQGEKEEKQKARKPYWPYLCSHQSSMQAVLAMFGQSSNQPRPEDLFRNQTLLMYGHHCMLRMYQNGMQ